MKQIVISILLVTLIIGGATSAAARIVRGTILVRPEVATQADIQDAPKVEATQAPATLPDDWVAPDYVVGTPLPPCEPFQDKKCVEDRMISVQGE